MRLPTFLARLLNRTPRAVDLSQFVAAAHAAARQGRAREAVMQEFDVATHGEYRRLARAARRLDPELPHLPVTRRYRNERIVGKGGLTIPLAACIEAGLPLGTRVELRYDTEGDAVEITKVEH